MDEKTLEQILKQSLENEQSQFILIPNMATFQALSEFRFEVRKLIKFLKRLCTKLSKTYRMQIHLRRQDPNILIALRQLLTCLNYYQTEYNIAVDMSMEYIEYALSGHLLDALFNVERAEEDMVDFRYK